VASASGSAEQAFAWDQILEPGGEGVFDGYRHVNTTATQK
jgi:hypothetical protein